MDYHNVILSAAKDLKILHFVQNDIMLRFFYQLQCRTSGMVVYPGSMFFGHSEF